MRYIKLSLKYIVNNFWWVLLLSVVPGVILGLCTDPTSIFSFLVDFEANSSAGFGSIFASVSELNLLSLLLGLILIPVFAVFISAMCGMISRHMRLGIRDAKGFFKRVNNNIMPVILVTLVVIVMLQLMAIMLAAFSYLWVKVISSTGFALGMSIGTAVVFMLMILLVMSFFLIWLPTMAITGLNAGRAFGTALSNTRGKLHKVFFAVTLPLIPTFGIMCIMAYFKFKFAFLINIVLYTFMVMYYVTLMYTTYCDINDVDREDLRDPFAVPKDNEEIE